MTLYLRNVDALRTAAERAGQRRATRLGYAGTPKRLLDICLVLLSSVVILPLVGLFLLLVARDGHPPIYRQRRVGRDGRIYYMLKIRTMVPDADSRLATHLAADPTARLEWDRLQKLRDDPRVTRIGRVLRKSSLDELPQLWNVLKGDMSLVGPRPMMVEQRPLYPGQAYYQLRPGITGPWQISDRNRSTFADRATFDDDYRANLSFRTDLAILLKTFGVVLRGTGC
jgi:lipopolysaccharide/colanic/teichoic acid biosynthesis glycosyltransferase